MLSVYFSGLRSGVARMWWSGDKGQGVWGTVVPQRGPGAEPRYGRSGGRSPPEAEAFSLIYVVILDVLTTICHKFEVVRIMYSEQRLGKVTHVGAVRPIMAWSCCGLQAADHSLFSRAVSFWSPHPESDDFYSQIYTAAKTNSEER